MTTQEGSSTFGQLLRRHRLAAGWTQQQLADQAGLSRRGIDDLERGVRRKPYLDTVQRLVAALSLTPDDAVRLEAAVVRTHGHSSALEPGSAGAALDGPRHTRLPAPLTALLGREREVAAVEALLQRDGVRLVTITGAGGIGKTRLSLQVAADLRDAFPDGVWYVSLARVSGYELVIPAIARVFDLQGKGGAPLAATLFTHLEDMRCLLVLDNFEHVINAAPFVVTLLESCVGVKALVTSRIALHVRGEHNYALPPLALPDLDHAHSSEELSQCPAVALFIERAQEAQAEALVTDAAMPAVAEICARLDGLPLAIELAATRIRLLPPPALLKRMEQALPLLRGGARDLDERQQTMRNTLAWSEDLLGPQERRLFHRLAVFAGGCTLEAADAVCASPADAEPLGIDVLSGLGILVDHSLVQQHEEGGEARFGMLHVIREFASDQLRASGEAEAVRQAHAELYERHAAHWRAHLAAQVDGAREPVSQAKHAWIESELGNLYSVLGWAIEQCEPWIGLSVARTLMTFWMRRGLYVEGSHWLERLLALPPPAAAQHGLATNAEELGRLREHQAYGWLFLGTLLGESGGTENHRRAVVVLEEAARQFRERGDLATMAETNLNLAAVLDDLGAADRAYAMAEDSLGVMRQLGRSGAVELGALSQLSLRRNDLDRARSFALEALRVTERAGRPWERPIDPYWTLACVALRQGDLPEARAQVRDALRWTTERDRHRGRMVPTLELFCVVDAAAGQHTRVAYVQGALELPTQQVGSAGMLVWKHDLEAARVQARAALGDEAWQAAYATGSTRSLEEIVAELLQTSD